MSQTTGKRVTSFSFSLPNAWEERGTASATVADPVRSHEATTYYNWQGVTLEEALAKLGALREVLKGQT